MPKVQLIFCTCKILFFAQKEKNIFVLVCLFFFKENFGFKNQNIQIFFMRNKDIYSIYLESTETATSPVLKSQFCYN